jgi:hypothetical protein
MRNASPIAEQELEEMFEKYNGDFVAVCKALVREWDDEISGIEERRAEGVVNEALPASRKSFRPDSSRRRKR